MGKTITGLKRLNSRGIIVYDLIGLGVKTNILEVKPKRDILFQREKFSA